MIQNKHYSLNLSDRIITKLGPNKHLIALPNISENSNHKSNEELKLYNNKNRITLYEKKIHNILVCNNFIIENLNYLIK